MMLNLQSRSCSPDLKTHNAFLRTGAAPMSNVVRLTERVSRRAQSNNERSGSAIDLNSLIGRIVQLQHASKEHLKEEVLLLVRSSARAQQIISQIKNDEIRARLSVRADRIRELAELAVRRVAEL